jgi:hypothetical protein
MVRADAASRRDQGSGVRAPRRLPAAVVLAAVLIGALQRWWVAAHPVGTLTADGAVIGLMALQLLHHGQLTAYMWGQSYGGSLEAVLTAAVFALAGAGRGQLLVTTAFSSALCAFALWRAGRRIVGEPAAQIAALAFWVWPASFLWRSVKPGGTYMIGLAVALCAVGALARIRQGEDGWRRCGEAGAWCGLAVWCSPMSLELLVPAALWVLPALRRAGRRLLAAAAGALAGGVPALVFGATHDWANLHVPGYGDDLLAGIPGRLRQFFPIEAPVAMGVRVEGSFAWVGGYLGEMLAVAGAGAVVVTAGAVIAGRAPRCTLPVLTIALLPVLYALNPLADNAGQGRYALFAVPMAALLIGTGLERAAAITPRHPGARGPRVDETRQPGGGRPRPGLAWTAGLAFACALGTAGLQGEPSALVAFPAPDVAMPTNDSALQALLAGHGVTDAYAPYWIAYRVMFETGARIRVTPYDYDRYPPIAAAVRASPHPAYLFITASGTLGSFETWCREHGVVYREWHSGGFTVVQPVTKVSPGELPHAVLY